MVTLNRAKVAKTQNLHKWDYVQNTQCPCGADVQAIAQILTDCPLSEACSDVDLKDASDTTRRWILRSSEMQWWFSSYVLSGLPGIVQGKSVT